MFADNLGLSPSISSQFTPLQPKIAKNPYFRVQGQSRSSILIILRSSSLVIVILSRMSVPICNHFYAREIAQLYHILATTILSVRHDAVPIQDQERFSPYDSLLSLVFRDKISSRWVKGIPSFEGMKEGHPLKKHYFTAIGSSNMKMVADRNRHAAYHNKHWRRAS